MVDPLLCFILLNGGEDHRVAARSIYEPLADFFGLTGEERTAPRKDGYPGKQWEMRVQWTRQRLINHGLIVNPPKDRSETGYWTRSPDGLRRAHEIAGTYAPLRRAEAAGDR
jgi:hypothetical protein